MSPYLLTLYVGDSAPGRGGLYIVPSTYSFAAGTQLSEQSIVFIRSSAFEKVSNKFAGTHGPEQTFCNLCKLFTMSPETTFPMQYDPLA